MFNYRWVRFGFEGFWLEVVLFRVSKRRVFVKMPRCFALLFLLFLEFVFDNIPLISIFQPLIEMNNRVKLPFNFCDFTLLLYKSPRGTKSN